MCSDYKSRTDVSRVVSCLIVGFGYHNIRSGLLELNMQFIIPTEGKFSLITAQRSSAMRVALIGQAAFGEAVYRQLLDSGESVAAVFYEREGDPLHTLAVQTGVDSYPTKNLRSNDFFQVYSDLEIDLNVMAFVTVIIPERVIDLPSKGTIQYHPSLLPVHRGRSAINWAIVNGEVETGITIFWPDKGIDTGPVLLQKTSPVTEDDTVSSLYRNSLFPLGVEGLAEAVSLIRQGIAPSIIQDESLSTYEPPMEGNFASIQWMRPAKQIYDLVRGCDSQPGASANLNGELVRLLDASLERRVGPGNYGELIGIDEDGIRIALNGGTLLIRRIRPEGSRAISSVEYAASVGLAVGHRFSV